MSDALNIPACWVASTIEETCDIWSGYGFPEQFQGRSQGEIPFFKVGDISEAWKRNEVYLSRANHYLTKEEAHQLRATPIPPETTVFAKVGAAIGLNRRAMLAVPSLVDNNVMGLFPKRGILDPKYLFYFTFTLRLMDLAKATTVPSVRKTEVAPIRTPLAPLNEQKRIAFEIEKQFTRLDDAVKALKRVQANLKRYRASVLKAACEGRLVPTEAELARKEGRNYEPANELLKRILVERRAKWEADQLQKMIAAGKPPKDDEWKSNYKEPESSDTADISQIPEGWTVASMDQLTTNITSGSRDWSQFYGRGAGVFIMAQNVRLGSLDLSFKQAVDPPPNDASRVRSAIYQDDLLVTIVGANTGDICRVPDNLTEHYVCQSVALMRPIISDLSGYIELYMCSPENGQRQYRRYIYGAGRPHLSFDQLRMTAVLLPPFAEMRRILVEAGAKISVLDSIEMTVKARLAHVNALRQGVLRRALSGKLVPQDPNDEPASVLLERIRAERASVLATNGKNHKAIKTAGLVEGQRQRRVRKLAQRASAGKGQGKAVAP